MGGGGYVVWVIIMIHACMRIDRYSRARADPPPPLLHQHTHPVTFITTGRRQSRRPGGTHGTAATWSRRCGSPCSSASSPSRSRSRQSRR